MEYQRARLDVPPDANSPPVLLLWYLQACKLLEKRGQSGGTTPFSPKAKVLSRSSLFAEKDFTETLSGPDASFHLLGMPHPLFGYTPSGHSI